MYQLINDVWWIHFQEVHRQSGWFLVWGFVHHIDAVKITIVVG